MKKYWLYTKKPRKEVACERDLRELKLLIEGTSEDILRWVIGKLKGRLRLSPFVRKGKVLLSFGGSTQKVQHLILDPPKPEGNKE